MEAYAFEAQYIRTNGGPEDGYPYHTVISSRAELEAYYEAYKDIYSLERRETVYSDSTIGFLDACDKYDNAYFERQNLVLIVLQEGSGSIRHEITDVRRHRIENGALDGWDITIDRKVPEAGTEDMAQWHLFLEVQMGDVIKATDKVWINGKQSERTPTISGLVGISRTPATHAYQDPWGVKLTAKNITPSGLTIVCTQQDGKPIGDFGTEYTYRAMVALVGLGANTVDVAIYPKTAVDETGAALTGEKKYTLHFETLPPTLEGGFWSVTAYGEDDFLIDNSIDRYCINDRSDFKLNADGTLDIILSKDAPEDTSNWLPVSDGEFHLFMRIYVPDMTALDSWQPPVIREQ